MSSLSYFFCKNEDDLNQEILREIWGDSLKKLTPKQRQLVVEVLSQVNQNKRDFTFQS